MINPTLFKNLNPSSPMRSIYLILLILTSFSFQKCTQNQDARNPPEIVSRDTDTVFNDIPGKQHLGIESFNMDVVELMESVRKNTVFLEGLVATGVIDTLASEGPFTVFAPVNEAFPWYTSDTVNKEPAVPAATFTEEMIKAHIVSGLIRTDQLADGPITVTTLNGNSLILRLEEGRIVINDNVEVLNPNINATNGVVHEIGELLSSPL